MSIGKPEEFVFDCDLSLILPKKRVSGALAVPTKKQKLECIDSDPECINLVNEDLDQILLDLTTEETSCYSIMTNSDTKDIIEEHENTVEVELPLGWIQKTTKHGNILYQNTTTQEISTIFPQSNTTKEEYTPPPAPLTRIQQEKQAEIDLFSEIISDEPLPPSILDSIVKSEDKKDVKVLHTEQQVLSAVQNVLTVPLFEHQKEAVLWMREHENHKEYRGGILADDMGCGKTLSIIALMIANPNPNHERQHNLLVVPFSLLYQWKEEIERRTKKDFLKRIYIQHGANRTNNSNHFKKYDVVITTYGCLSSEFNNMVLGKDRSPLLDFKWFRVILDEAHIIKNRQTRTSYAAFKLRASKRWCMTGTPILNNINDIHTLFGFLRFKPYGDVPIWKTLILDNIARDPNGTMETLRGILKQIVLRRRKDSVLKDSLKLTERKVEQVALEFSEHEREYYTYIENCSRRQFQDMVMTEKDVRENYIHILCILNRMRQACCDTSLVNWKGQAPDLGNSSEDEIVLFDEEVKERLVIDPCAICLLENDEIIHPVATPCGHKFCDECIREWIETHNTCPNCMNEVDGEEELTDVNIVLKSKPTEPRKTITGGSTKTKALIQEVQAMIDTSNDKCLIVSQWTSYLAIIGTVLRDKGIEFYQLDGSQTMMLRHNTVSNFENGNVRVLLVSMRAAGVGLNIIAANRVYTMDLWWNLGVENQVIDRVHRIGQKKDVIIKRFTIRESIEERILQLQEEKKLISDCALSDANSHLSQRMDLNAFLHLFGIKNYRQESKLNKNTKKPVVK